MPTESLIIGVDLAPIKPIPRVITFQGDITTDQCRATIRQYLKSWKADTVLHDGAPNVGTAWNQDSFNQAELVLQSMKLATEFLVEGGTFVTKVFRSKDYNPLLWVFNQLFTKVEATKPPSSRSVSAEIFVVCRGYKAPKRMDPRFLDPRAVFADLSNPTPNNEAKVYKPETKKRKREGYEEGDYTQFKEVSASEFIQTTDPLDILANCNRLSFVQPTNGDVALAALDKLAETTGEIRNACADLKVLNRKDFKDLLRWRIKVREIFGLPTKKKQALPESEEVVEVESMDEELRIQEELQALKDKENAKKKRERRKDNEKKQKEIVRMQMHMITPMDIGMEQDGPMGGEGSMFALKTIDGAEALKRINRGKMATINKLDKEAPRDKDSGLGSSGETEDEDEAEDRLERDLDNDYDQYRQRREDQDAKLRAKRAREEHAEEDFEGFSVDGSDKDEESDDSELEEDESDGEADDAEASTKPLITDLDNTPTSGPLSKRAAKFFNQDVFAGILGPINGSADEDVLADASRAKAKDASKGDKAKEKAKKLVQDPQPTLMFESDDDIDDDPGLKPAKQTEDDWEEEKPKPNDRPGELCRRLPMQYDIANNHE